MGCLLEGKASQRTQVLGLISSLMGRCLENHMSQVRELLLMNQLEQDQWTNNGQLKLLFQVAMWIPQGERDFLMML